MNRYTFVIHVHPDGITTLENLSSHERVQIFDLGEVGPRIGTWLAELTALEGDVGAPTVRGSERSAGAG